jgi:peptide-methionine (S)-S-oxide reductase
VAARAVDLEMRRHGDERRAGTQHFHDPTTLDRQGADVGTQYRSVVFWHSPEQRAAALETIAKLEKQHVFRDKIVTQVEPYRKFYAAEAYHQAYYDKNSDRGYCQVVIAPKLAKLRAHYAAKLKPSM